MEPAIQKSIKRDVEDQIQWDDAVNAGNIEVEVVDDTVILNGDVSGFTAKSMAEKDAWLVMGVRQVENNLRIQYPKNTTKINDEEIKANIQNMFLWNSNIQADNIAVEVHKGIVVLKGSTGTLWEKELAAELAMSATGVIDLISEIEVKLWQPFDDESIRTDIENAIQRNPLMQGHDIYVRVEAGKVQLLGEAPNYQVKHYAHKIARFTAGVKEIEDRVKIKQGT